MKKLLVAGLTAAVLSGGVAACGDGLSTESLDLDMSQGVLFHVSYTNSAWGFVSGGFYIDNEGNVWRMSSALWWGPEVDRVFNGEVDVSTYPAADLEESYASLRDSVVAVIDSAELVEKFVLVREAAQGAYSARLWTGADMGSLVTGVLLYDPATDTYRRVILSVTGDWTVINLSGAAKELDGCILGVVADVFKRSRLAQ